MREVDYLTTDLLIQENKALKKENKLLKTIIDNCHEMVFAVNNSDQLILYNSESERTEGLSREDVLGKEEMDIYPNYYWAQDVTNKIRKTQEPIIEKFYEYDLPNGRKANMIYSSFPFFYEGKIDTIFTIGRSLDQINRFITLTIEKQKELTLKKKDSSDVASYLLDDIIGTSNQICETVSLARRISGSSSPILIVGETGTGKELFAQGIHNASFFSGGPFIPINCAAIPETLLESVLFGTVKGAFTGAIDIPGLFEQAENGTIFLDEINSMPISLQAKLLRVLQSKTIRRLGSRVQVPINCRVISATNVDPSVAIKENAIRDDLFYRLATIVINIPPLRERKGDIEVLSNFFIKKFNNSFGVSIRKMSNELLSIFEQYSWPGNVRELENIIECGMHFVVADELILQTSHFPDYIRGKISHLTKDNSEAVTSLKSTLFVIEKIKIEECLKKHNGNITKTANELGISRQSLHYKIKTMRICNLKANL